MPDKVFDPNHPKAVKVREMITRAMGVWDNLPLEIRDSVREKGRIACMNYMRKVFYTQPISMLESIDDMSLQDFMLEILEGYVDRIQYNARKKK